MICYGLVCSVHMWLRKRTLWSGSGIKTWCGLKSQTPNGTAGPIVSVTPRTDLSLFCFLFSFFFFYLILFGLVFTSQPCLYHFLKTHPGSIQFSAASNLRHTALPFPALSMAAQRILKGVGVGVVEVVVVMMASPIHIGQLLAVFLSESAGASTCRGPFSIRSHFQVLPQPVTKWSSTSSFSADV